MWLRLTDTNGSPIFVNMDNVLSAQANTRGGTTFRTTVVFGNDTHNIDVQEKPNDIAGKVRVS